jgi:hypothetical protein
MAARNHPLQIDSRGTCDEADDRETVNEVFQPLDQRFGGFTVDVAASANNRKCERYYTWEQDGCAQSWAGELVWCNPPFSDIRRWVEKAWAEYTRTRGIVMLLPANRTEQPWWQELIEPYRDRATSPHGPQFTVEFLPGRLRFLKPGQVEIRPHERPPFGCCLLIWSPGYGPIGSTLPKPGRRQPNAVRGARLMVAEPLLIVPVSFKEARAFVAEHHRHHGRPPRGHKFSIGLAIGDDLVGIAMIGRPVARHLDDGLTLEVNRTCIAGTVPNGNSMLYGAAWRAAKALGYTRLITYTQTGESGTSLRAAGWRVIAQRKAHKGWDRPLRPRRAAGNENIQRTLWEAA